MDKKTLQSIDAEIRPLVAELNRMGLVTKFSCQGHEPEIIKDAIGREWINPRPAYITFDMENINRFHVDFSIMADGKPAFSIYWTRTQ